MKCKVICISGSLRYWNDILVLACKLTSQGYIVLSPFPTSFVVDNIKEINTEMLLKAHFQKIDMCDELIVVNTNNYIGNSTRLEIAYALDHNKTVSYTVK